ncbi:MAG: mannitol dehydrogenase family protein [Defluviitaleaceae bacterium]|nr:mannitol dehydrogenase family protein [Defluviitaleaceae bacterium]
MKLNLRGPESTWKSDYVLPKFDIAAMRAKTAENPTWLHIGAGNIFRVFVAAAHQDLLDAGLADTGIVVYEGFDEEIIPRAFKPYDNLTLGVTLHADGSVEKRVIASVADAFSCDLTQLCEIIAKPSLQMISLTITEKGYAVNPQSICASPAVAKTTIEQLTAGLLARFEAAAPPLALVAMDNFAENGTHLKNAVLSVAQTWDVSPDFIKYAETLAFPWTMIDKITPRPSKEVAKILEADGFEDTEIIETTKHTFVAPFVNAEAAAYLVIEDDFPNGRPPLELVEKLAGKLVGKLAGKRAGIYMTDRETVRKTDQMKVCACLNPLHTILAVTGMLLGYPTISACMKDENLVALIRRAALEAMPAVEHPGIIDPADFLHEVLTARFPNPFIPDTPARIACDTSQKIPIRFGVTLKKIFHARAKHDSETEGASQDRHMSPKQETDIELEAIPLFFALFLRYRMGIDDKGAKLNLSPDPSLPEELNTLYGLPLGAAKKIDLRPILSNEGLFGVNLYEVGLGEKIEKIFAEISAAPGAVNYRLKQNIWIPLIKEKIFGP